MRAASTTRRSLLLAGTCLAAALGAPAWAVGRNTKRKRVPPITDANVPELVAYGERDDVMRFAEALAERRGLDAAWVRTALTQACSVPSVARFIMPPPAGTSKNWYAYRARFVEPVRIKAGVEFWMTNAQWLATAEKLYGVPPEIVVGILGVETIYGRQMGNFRVIDALSTLAFDFPSGRSDRSDFFRDELESWFVLCKNEGVEPLDWKSSYAGAIGMAQFMPSSFNKYAVDLDADGHVDLQRSAADAIGSVANYLAAFGWKRGLPVHFQVTPPKDADLRAALLTGDVLPTFSASELAEKGAVLQRAARSVEGNLALVELQNGASASSYVAGTSNFYAITRYNRSSYYAMAVAALGETVRDAGSSAARYR